MQLKEEVVKEDDESREKKGVKNKLRNLIKSKKFRSTTFVIFTTIMLTATSLAVNAAIVKKESNEVKEAAGSPEFQEILKSYPASYGLVSYPKSYPQSYPQFQLKQSKVTKLGECESEYANGNFSGLKFDFNSCEMEYVEERSTSLTASGVPLKTLAKFKDLKGNFIFVNLSLYVTFECGGPFSCNSKEPLPIKVSDTISRIQYKSVRLSTPTFLNTEIENLQEYTKGYLLAGNPEYDKLMSEEGVHKEGDNPSYCSSPCSLAGDGFNLVSSGIIYNDLATFTVYGPLDEVRTDLKIYVQDNSGDLAISDNFSVNFKLK